METQTAVYVSSPETSDDEIEKLNEIHPPARSNSWVISLLKHLAFLASGLISTSVPVISLVLSGKVSLSDALKDNIPLSELASLNVTVRILVWLGSSIIVMTFLSLLVDITPFITLKFVSSIVPHKSEAFKYRVELYSTIKKPIKILFFGLVILILWCVFFPESVVFYLKKESKNAFSWGFLGLFCFFVILTLYSIEKILIKIIAINFHRTSCKNRLEKASYAAQVLDTLSQSRFSLGGASKESIDMYRSESYDESSLVPSLKAIKSLKRGTTFPSLTEESINNAKMTEAFISITTELIEGQPDEDIDLNSKTAARKLARKIFNQFKRINPSEKHYHITLNDFQHFFLSPEEAVKAFNLFDSDGNGDISQKEMRSVIARIYKERKDITSALQDCSDIVKQLNTLFSIVFLIIAAFLCSAILGQNLYALLLPFGTFIFSLSFLLADTAKELFRSLIFIFIKHPFDSGDRVCIEQEIFTVKSVSILGTSLVRSNGQTAYISNGLLSSKIIYNICRSTSHADKIEFQIDLDTPPEKIESLQERIQSYVAHNCRDFQPSPQLVLEGISQGSKLNWFINLVHKGNGQDCSKTWARRTKFILALQKIFLDLDLRYTLPAQRPNDYIQSNVFASEPDPFSSSIQN